MAGLHPEDKELIKSWMQRDWAENLYPGPTNAEGRKLLEEHLAAMFDLETEQPPLVELDGRLVLEAQKTLARMSVAQRAYELLKSEGRERRTPSDWNVARKGGLGCRERIRGRPGPITRERSAFRLFSPIAASRTNSWPNWPIYRSA